MASIPAAVIAAGTTAYPYVVKAYNLIDKFITQYQEMKKADEQCRKNLSELKLLLALLTTIKQQDHTYSQPSVMNVIKQIVEKFTEYEKKHFKRMGKNDVEKFIFPKKNEMMEMQSLVTRYYTVLTAALQVDAKEDRDREENRRIHEENFARRFNRLSSVSIKEDLEPVKLNRAEYRPNGQVILSWQDDNDLQDLREYQLEINHEEKSRKYTVDIKGGRRHSADPFTFLPHENYLIKIRATKPALSSWSESIVVRVPRAPPNRPKHPPELLTYLCSTTGSSNGAVDRIKLRVHYPSEKDCNGEPLEGLKVYHSDENSNHTLSSNSYSVRGVSPNDNGHVFVTIGAELDLDLKYMFRVAWVNKCGESEYSDSLTVCKNDAVPGPPASIRESTKKTDKLVKLRWAKPVVNAFAVSHYEVHMMDETGTFNFVSDSSKCSYTVRKLSQTTKYVFRVCSVGKNGIKSPFPPEITIETDASKAVKGVAEGAVVTAGIASGVVGGLVSGPVIGTGLGVAAGQAAASKVKNKAGKAVVGTLAGVAAGVPSVLVGTLLTPVSMVVGPVVGGVAAKVAFDEEMEKKWSDQSSDEAEDN